MDTNFCVYIHISSDGEVFYVGQGREHRAYCKSAIGRAKKWYTIAEKGYDVYIPYTDLTKDQAVQLEKKTILSLMEKGHPLVNKSIHDGVMTLTREMFEDSFEYKEDSKFGLVWKRDSINKKLIGKEAGTKNKITGYVTVSMDSRQYSVHRIVMALTSGVCPHDMQVNHINGNKSDNRIENLELVTAKENVQHALRTGLTKPCFGEANSAAIITEKIVLEMYEHFRKGLSNEEVADIYNIEWKHASLIRCGKRWKHLFKDHGYDIPRSTKTKVVTDEQIVECLHLIDCGLINKDISDATGIERSTVSRIRSGDTLQVRIKTLLKLKGNQMKELLIFSANEWCSACQNYKKVLQDTVVPVDRLRCFDVDESPDLAREYQIRGVPTSILILDGKEVKRKTGMMLASELIAFCEV